VDTRPVKGAPALLLHGGPGLPDYLDGLADELDGVFAATRYTQRGCPPSDAPGPYTVEAHVEDAFRVLDAVGIERAWAVGRSWGGHLALYMAIQRPQRLHGVISDGLGVDPSVFPGQDSALRRGLSSEQIAYVEAVEAARRGQEVTEEELLERLRLLWPHFFASPAAVVPPPERIGVRASIEGNASLRDHFSRKTLVRALPSVRLPALFVHGALDAVPVRSSTVTAALVRGARVEVIDDCGHFPWAERPGELRRRVETFLAAQT
jgi:pimeloyl-ACP methyl ester carboxylesterase